MFVIPAAPVRGLRSLRNTNSAHPWAYLFTIKGVPFWERFFYGGIMFIGNLLWFLLGGFISSILWAVAGLLWCCTIIGIPIGIQCFKYAGLVCCPFGRDVVNDGSFTSLVFNILWICFSGIELAVWHFCVGLIFCITIIGIPFGRQHFKLAVLALMPFGSHVV